MGVPVAVGGLAEDPPQWAEGPQRASEALGNLSETPSMAANLDKSPVTVERRLPAQHAGQRAFFRG